MAAKKVDRSAQFRRAAHRRTDPGAAPAGTTAVRSKPVRITVDLAPDLYKQLTRWAAETALEVDRPRLPQAEVIRACIRALTDDPDVREAVLRELRLESDS